jgi:hypothetical protein
LKPTIFCDDTCTEVACITPKKENLYILERSFIESSICFTFPNILFQVTTEKIYKKMIYPTKFFDIFDKKKQLFVLFTVRPDNFLTLKPNFTEDDKVKKHPIMEPQPTNVRKFVICIPKKSTPVPTWNSFILKTMTKILK